MAKISLGLMGIAFLLSSIQVAQADSPPRQGMREVSVVSRPNQLSRPGNAQNPNVHKERLNSQAVNNQGEGCPAGTACSAQSQQSRRGAKLGGLPPNAPKGTGTSAGKGLVPFGGAAPVGGPEIGSTLEPPVVVLPETTTAVKLSASDLNRVICPYDIKEGLTSEEKGLTITVTGKDAFLKYKVMKRGDGKLSYSNTPTEIFIVCGNQTFSMIGYPSRVPAQTIKLSSGTENKIKENQSLFSGLPHEKKMIKAIKDIYTDSMPNTYDVLRLNKVDTTWKSIVITQKRQVDIQGEGLRIKEYHISLKPGRRSFKLDERLFLRKDFAINPVAISIDKHVLKQGGVSRLFVVEQRAEREFAGESLKLPSVDGAGVNTSQDKSESGGKQEKAENVADASMGNSMFNSQEPMAGLGVGGDGMRIRDPSMMQTQFP